MALETFLEDKTYALCRKSGPGRERKNP